MRRLLAKGAPRAAPAAPLLVDDGNRASATAISRLASARGFRAPAEIPPPLVLVGPADSGKSRLLAELADGVTARGGSVVAGTATDWARRVARAYRAGALGDLSAAVAAADLLIVDELHRLGRASSTREFLARRIAERNDARKLSAVATRHAPRDIRRFPERATSLLLGGMVLYVARPGAAVRKRFLARLAQGRLAEDALDRILAGTAGGLGALRSAFESRAGGVSGAGPSSVRVERLVAAVAREVGVPASQLAGRRRTAGVVRARAVLLLAARRLGIPATALATGLDGRGLQSIARGEAKARDLAARDAAIRAAADRIAVRLSAETGGS